MNVRLLSVLWLIGAFSSAATAQTVVCLVDGRKLSTTLLEESAAEVRTDSGSYLRRDILYVTSGKEHFVYRTGSGEREKVKLKETCRACRAGRAYAAKYAGSGLELEQFDPPVPAHFLSDTLFMKFFRREMFDRDVPVDAAGHLRETGVKRVDTVRTVREAERTAQKKLQDRRVVYLRNGDSLDVETDFFPKKDTLCWFGGGRMQKDRVLAIHAGEKQWVMNDRSSTLVKVKPPKFIGDACAKGELLTLIYEGSSSTDAEINAVNAELLKDPAVRSCFMMPERVTAPDRRKSYISLGAGVGPGHGMVGLRTVIGPNGSGLAIGTGSLEGQFCYSAGLQILLGQVLYINGSYGTYEVGSISSGPLQEARKYAVEGYNIFMGIAPRIGKEKKFFLEAGAGYSGGGTAPGPYGSQPSSGVGFDVGFGVQL